MRIDAIIPARGGSKRIPGKNKKALAGKPLVVWSIERARAAAIFTHIVVSTDDPDIAEIALTAGAEVPGLRPAQLASDAATTIDVVLDLLQNNPFYHTAAAKPEAIMLLQPTAPLRTPATLLAAFTRYQTHAPESVVSVSPCRSHPYLCKYMDGQANLRAPAWVPQTLPRSQDLPPFYALNGVVYVAATATLLRRRSLYSAQTKGLLITDPAQAVDIDTPEDWRYAEYLIANQAINY